MADRASTSPELTDLKRKQDSADVSPEQPAEKRSRGRPRKPVAESEESPNNGGVESVDFSGSDPEVEAFVAAERNPALASTSASALVSAQAPGSATPAEKRGRGRPRKSAIESPAPTGGADPSHDEQVVKRARGRPKKDHSGAKAPPSRLLKSVLVPSAASAAPKRRGRPAKGARGGAGANAANGKQRDTSSQSPDIVLSTGKSQQAHATAQQGAHEDSLDGYQSAHESLHNTEELLDEIASIKTELAEIKQRQKEQEELDVDVISSLRQEIAELREIVMLSSADASRAILGVGSVATTTQDAESMDAALELNGAEPKVRRSGALSTAARKVLKGIAHYEYVDPDNGEVDGALLGEVAEYALMDLEDVVIATEELVEFGLIDRTKEDHAWVLNESARKIVKP